MKIQGLGHVVLQVRSRERSEAFYTGLLGIPVAVRYEPVRSTFFSLGDDHHCLAVIEIGEDAPQAPPGVTGLRHIAFRLADAADELPAIMHRLEAAGASVERALDHGITHSLYVKDPDGNTVELYVDVSDAWRADPEAIVVAPTPLRLA